MVVVKQCNILLVCQQVYQEVGNGAIDFGIYGLQALSSTLSFWSTVIDYESTVVWLNCPYPYIVCLSYCTSNWLG